MAHPFFDTFRYPWSRPEATELYSRLVDLYPMDALEILYKQCGGDWNDIIPSSLNAVWRQALDLLTSAKLLRVLCNEVKMRYSNNQTVILVIQKVENAEPIVLRTSIIADKIFILDRIGLRQGIVSLTDESPAATKVLLVTGSKKSGKSWCRHLFIETARDAGAKAVYLGRDYPDLGLVIMELFSALGAPATTIPVFTSEEAWYTKVCILLKGVSSEKQTRLWIAADDLGMEDGAPLIDTKIRTFFEQFTLLMRNPTFGDHFRLMLIDYPHGNEKPTRWERTVWSEETTDEKDIQQIHVADFLRSWSIQHGRNVLEDDLMKLSADLIAQAETQTPGPARLQRIHDGLTQTLAKLNSQV